VVGRGLSDWLTVKTDYTIPLYVSDLFTLLGKIRPKTLHWLGTSMGGLIGMTLAAQPMSPIDKLVLNDVGPVLSAASLERIGRYVAETPHFATLEEAEAYLRRIHAPFGPLTDAQWRHLTLHSVRQDVDGRWVLRYDPASPSPSRRNRRSTSTSGPCGTPSAAPPWCCAAPNRICSRARPPRR